MWLQSTSSSSLFAEVISASLAHCLGTSWRLSGIKSWWARRSRNRLLHSKSQKNHLGRGSWPISSKVGRPARPCWPILKTSLAMQLSMKPFLTCDSIWMLFEFYVKVYLKLIWVKFNLDIKPLFKFWLNLLIPNLGEATFWRQLNSGISFHTKITPRSHRETHESHLTPRSHRDHTSDWLKLGVFKPEKTLS